MSGRWHRGALALVLIAALFVAATWAGQLAQYLSATIPLTYFLRIVRGIVLTGVGFSPLWPSLLPLLVFGGIIVSLAVLKCRKTLD